MAASIKAGPRTKVSETIEEHRRFIQCKSLFDPSLSIAVKGGTVALAARVGVRIKIPRAASHGSAIVHFVDCMEHDRTAQLRRVNGRVDQGMVGEASWEWLADEGAQSMPAASFFIQ